jgi:hypothetical protein
VCHNSGGNVESLEDQAPLGLPRQQVVSKKRRRQPQMLNSEGVLSAIRGRSPHRLDEDLLQRLIVGCENYLAH